MTSLNTLAVIILSILTSLCVLSDQFIFLLILIPILILILIFTRKKHKILTILFAVMAFTVSYFKFENILSYKIPDEYLNITCTSVAKTSNFSTFANYPKSFEISSINLNDKWFKTRIRVYLEGEPPSPFSEIKIKGKIKKSGSYSISKISSYSYVIYATDIQVIKESPIFRSLNSLRSEIISNVSLSMKSQASQILLSMVLGTPSLAYDEKEIYIRTGTAHIFAVSGLHISIIHKFIEFLFFKFPFIGNIASFLIVLFFIFIIGFRISAIRAFTMYTFVLIGGLLGKGKNYLNFLLCSAIVILMFSPEALFSLSFILSFLSVLGLIVMPNVITFEEIRKSKLYSLLISTFSTELMIIPLIIYYFNTFPVVSAVANVFAIPTMIILEPLGLLQSAFASISLRVSKILAPLTNALFGAFNKIIALLSKVPYSCIYLESNKYLSILLITISLLTSLSLIYKRILKAKILIIAYIFVFILFIIMPKNGIYSGKVKGENYYLINENGNIFLFLLNSNEYSRNDLNFELKKIGVQTIDVLVINHVSDEENWSNGLDLLKNPNYKIINAFAITQSNYLINEFDNLKKIEQDSIILYKTYKIILDEKNIRVIHNNKEITVPFTDAFEIALK